MKIPRASDLAGWTVEAFDSAELLARRLASLAGVHPRWLFRGEPREFEDMKPRIGRGPSPLDRDAELAVLLLFAEQVCGHLSGAEEQAMRHVVATRRLSASALQVAQHYGLATRLIDWTMSPWVAAFFAAWQSSSEGGRIWCIDRIALERAIGEIWDGNGFERTSESTIDIDRLLHEPDERDWFTTLYSLVPFTRLRMQHGLFATSSRPHKCCRQILEILLPKSARICLTVRAEHKSVLMGQLDLMGTRAYGLDIPAAEIIAASITSSVMAAVARSSEPLEPTPIVEPPGTKGSGPGIDPR